MKYALIGCGRISPNHIGSALDHKLDIRAVCDRKEEKAAALLERYGLQNVKIYTDYRKMMDEVNPELVAVATESGYHPDIAIDCIRHGCNVIIEKPLALSMADARRVIAARDEMGVVAAVNQQNRFNAPSGSSAMPSREEKWAAFSTAPSRCTGCGTKATTASLPGAAPTSWTAAR